MAKNDVFLVGPSRSSLEALAHAVGAHLNIPENEIGVRVSTLGVDIKFGTAHRRVRNYDPFIRAAVYLLPVGAILSGLMLVPTGVWGGATWLAVMLFAHGLAITLLKQLDGNYASRVKTQFARARQSAATLPDMAIETLVALWAAREARPLLGGVLDLWAFTTWWSQGNNVDKSVSAPLQEALRLLATDVSAAEQMKKGGARAGWALDARFDQAITLAESYADKMEKAWKRTTAPARLVLSVENWLAKKAFGGGVRCLRFVLMLSFGIAVLWGLTKLSPAMMDVYSQAFRGP